ncbi:MAG: M24 family metallopeptidase [Acidobacteria bacterium]|nr:MAG: M24 family metallopeptidase [Acidobacteriota bacterium]
MRRVIVLLLVVFGLGASAQPVFRGTEIFPAEEFAARRARVMTEIGDGVAIVLGTTEPAGEMPFRQNSQFFYLTGVTEPRASVVIDGRAKTTTVFLQPKTARQDDSQYGKGMGPGPDAARTLGVDAAVDRAGFTAAIESVLAAKRVIYTPFAAEVLGSQSQGDPTRLWTANKQDPWDGRDSREATFIAKLKEKAFAAGPAPGMNPDVKNLDPIVNAMRAVKSAREVAVIREATNITGLAIMAAMRESRPGLREYELQAPAEYVFKKHGALGASYFALIATGQNTYYTHYNRNTAVLADGDLVQFDYAPDYKYYQSDVTRVFPANGKFTPRQREMYGIYLKLYQAVLTSINVHITPSDVIKAALVKMDAIMSSYPFTDARIKTAATNFVENYRRQQPNARSLGHNVGMEVHDVGGLQAPTLEPGRVFTIEPQFRIEEEHLGIRLEDMILITDTGYENLSAFVPIEIDDIERWMATREAALVPVRLETALGDIDIALDAERAPISTANFLKYVDGGFYEGGRFHRTTRPETYNPVLPNRPPMRVIQAGIKPGARPGIAPIPLERTSATGLHHLKGTVSMARGGPDTATSDFFICLEDDPTLDFGWKRFDDGQGAAAFGHVTRGFDVVQKINAQPTAPRQATPDNPLTLTQNLAPPIGIIKACRIVAAGMPVSGCPK